jgi:hypothetical protein
MIKNKCFIMIEIKKNIEKKVKNFNFIFLVRNIIMNILFK